MAQFYEAFSFSQENIRGHQVKIEHQLMKHEKCVSPRVKAPQACAEIGMPTSN